MAADAAPASARALGTDQIVIAIAGSSDVKDIARDVLREAVETFGADMLDEASKYEAARNRKFTPAIDYSPSDIGQAESVVRNRGFTPQPRTAAYWIMRVLQWLLTGFAGVMGGLLPTWNAAGYLLAGGAVAALALTVYLEFSDYEERNGGKRNRRK